MTSVRAMRTAIAAAFIASAGPAFAHPKLVSSTPAAQTVVRDTSKLTLTFSERLMPQLSGVALVMTGHPGMPNHPPMKISGFKTNVAADGKTMIAAFPRPLSAGTYQLSWHAVAADTHRITGTFSFTVQ